MSPNNSPEFQISVSLNGITTLFQRAGALGQAGISCASGIPDYRGPEGVYTRNKDYKPIMYQEFIGDDLFRRRYWARSFLGSRTMIAALPNDGHKVINNFLALNKDSRLITQNVDGLHLKAGSESVELHGTLSSVICLSCKHTITREEFQRMLELLNPEVFAFAKLSKDDRPDVASSNPDGDKDYPFDYADFKYVDCTKCHGTLKPKVIFFGENIPETDKTTAFEYIDQADALVVVGTSLTTYSALRLVKRAKSAGKPVVIINVGPTRGDQYASLKIEEDCSATLLSIDI